jgi:hypothetical protein
MLNKIRKIKRFDFEEPAHYKIRLVDTEYWRDFAARLKKRMLK